MRVLPRTERLSAFENFWNQLKVSSERFREICLRRLKFRNRKWNGRKQVNAYLGTKKPFTLLKQTKSFLFLEEKPAIENMSFCGRGLQVNCIFILVLLHISQTRVQNYMLSVAIYSIFIVRITATRYYLVKYSGQIDHYVM